MRLGYNDDGKHRSVYHNYNARQSKQENTKNNLDCCTKFARNRNNDYCTLVCRGPQQELRLSNSGWSHVIRGLCRQQQGINPMYST